MTAVYTSRVWTCWDQMYDSLAAATWPAHPTTGRVPPVQFAGSRDDAQEMITVPGLKPPSSPTQDNATLGVVGRDETFTLVVVIWSAVPGYIDTTHGHDPSRAVRQRVRDLAAVVESTFRNQTTGRPAGINILNVWNWAITAMVPSCGPLSDGGFGANVTIEYTFQARI